MVRIRDGLRLRCRESIRTYRNTTLAVLLGMFVLGIRPVFQVPIFHRMAVFLGTYDAWEGDLFLLWILALCAGFALDMLRRSRRIQQENERYRIQLDVLRATLVTVNDIVLNFLDHLQKIRLEAQDTLSAESLKHLDEQINRTAAQLRHLGQLECSRISEGRQEGASFDPPDSAAQPMIHTQADTRLSPVPHDRCNAYDPIPR